MRPSAAVLAPALALALAAPLPLAAQSSAPDRVFTPAPVPGVSSPTVAPADRAGSGPGVRATDSGPTDSTPFSAAPSGTLGGSPLTGSGSTSRDGGSLQSVTPNLGK